MPVGKQRYCSRSCARHAVPPQSRVRKLTPEQVDEIRRRYIPQPKMAQLAKEFKVSPGMISRIVNRKGYKDYSLPVEIKRPGVSIEELKRRANAKFFGEE